MRAGSYADAEVGGAACTGNGGNDEIPIKV